MSDEIIVGILKLYNDQPETMRNFWLILLLCTAFYCRAQIDVATDLYTVDELVRDVLINSNCAETSNYSSFTGIEQGVNGIGYFNANSSGFQYQEGIVLSTGHAVDSEGPNTMEYNTSPTQWTGDVDLSGVTGKPILFNASFIQFDFVPRTNSISFNFLFASEEYGDNYQCIFSDVFAFILTGPDGVSTNLAVIPDTDELVSVTSIRPGIPDLCEPANEEYFFDINGSNSPISQQGQTVSLTARSLVVPLATYTIKLVIADNRDSELDSAVYLEAGSFSIDVSLGKDRTFAEGNPICDGETISLNAFADGAQDYIWYRDDVELITERNKPAIEVSDTGKYSVQVVFSATCVSNGEITLEYVVPPVIAEQPSDLTACDINGDGLEIFDFSQNTGMILGNQDPAIYQVYYFNTLEDAENFDNQINVSDEYQGTRPNEVIYARVSSQQSCYEVANFEIHIQELDFTDDLEEQYALCLDVFGNPITPFPILNTGLSENDYDFQWYRGAVSEENSIVGAIEPSFSASQAGEYNVVVHILSIGCKVPLSTMVNISSPPESVTINLVSELFASNTIVEIRVPGAGDYLYSLDSGLSQNSNRFSGIGPGKHTAAVFDTNGCYNITEEFVIIDYPRFFTPNADGSNDTWSIIGLDEIESPEITIYDRQGKLLYQLSDIGWDGMFDGRPLPSSDYWFRISYALNGGRKEFKGHFSLKR